MQQRNVYAELYRTRLDREGVPVAGERVTGFPDALACPAFHRLVRIIRAASERRSPNGRAAFRQTFGAGGEVRGFTFEVPSASGNGEALAYTFKYHDE